MKNNKLNLSNIISKLANCLKILSISASIGIELLISIYIFIPATLLEKISNKAHIENYIIIFLILYALVLCIGSVLVNKKLRCSYKIMDFIFSYLITYTISHIVLLLACALHIVLPYHKSGVALLALMIEVMILLISQWRSNNVSSFIDILSTTTFYSMVALIVVLFMSNIYIDSMQAYKYPVKLAVDFIILLASIGLVLVSKFKLGMSVTNVISTEFKVESINILSFGFSYICIFAIIATLLKWDSDQDWISILAVSIIIILLLIIFGSKIKKWEFGSFYFIYFLTVSGIPMVVYLVFLTKDQFGRYSSFKILTVLILLIGALSLETLGSSDIKEAYLDDTHKIDRSKVAKVRLFVVNLTALVTFENAIFTDQNSILRFCNNFGILLQKINLIQIPDALNSIKSKIAIFVVMSNILVFISSFILIKLEKHIFLKLTI